MGDPLIRDLRVPKMNAASTMAEAADEIERLRRLLSAIDSPTGGVNFNDIGPGSLPYPEPFKPSQSFLSALRKAVGR